MYAVITMYCIVLPIVLAYVRSLVIQIPNMNYSGIKQVHAKESLDVGYESSESAGGKKKVTSA